MIKRSYTKQYKKCGIKTNAKQKPQFSNEKEKGGLKMGAKCSACAENPKCAFIRVNDVMEILGISSAAAYNLVKQTVETQTPFRAIVAGNIFLIEKTSFDRFIGKDRSEDPSNV